MEGIDWFAEVVAFVARATGGSVLEACIRRAPAKEVAGLVRRLPGAAAQADGAAAVFLPETRAIVLSSDLDLGERFDRSFLVHELVHAQQFATGAADDAPCLGTLEGQAYRVQAQYLREGGLAKQAFLVSLLGLLQSACEYDY